MNLSPELRDCYRRVRVAVTGASGFIGRWVARGLSTCRAEVFLLVRDADAAAPIFTRYSICGRIVPVDLTCREAVEAVWEEIRPAVVFHVAGYGVDRAEREENGFLHVNVHAVQHVARAAAKYHDPSWPWVQFVHVGSVAEYGPIGGNLTESSRENPATLYGKSKLAGTRALAACCAETRLRGVTARLATVYGPGEHRGRLLPSLLEAAAATEPVCLSEGLQKRDFTYVEDAAEGLIRLAVTRAPPGEVVNVVTGELTTVRSFTQTAARILGISPARLAFGSLPVRYEEEMEHGPISNVKLRELTGWTPSIAVEEGIRRTVDFLAQSSPRENHV